VSRGRRRSRGNRAARPIRRVRRVLRGAALGAIAGSVATLPMSAPMLLAGQAGAMGRQPPRRLVDRVGGLTAAPGAERRRDIEASALHLAIGALGGAILGAGLAASGVDPRGRRQATAIGAAYGSALWLVNYAGLAPALDLLPPPDDDRPSRQATLFGAHLVFGAAAGLGLALEERLIPGPLP
jgi:hypothetical protein